MHAYSVAGKYAHCMQKITGSRPVCTFLKPWYVLVCKGMCLYVRVHSYMYWNVLVCTCHTGSFSMNQYVLVHTGTTKFVHTSTNWYILVCTVLDDTGMPC